MTEQAGIHPGTVLRSQRQESGIGRLELAVAARVALPLLEAYELGLRHPGDIWTAHVHRVLQQLIREASK